MLLQNAEGTERDRSPRGSISALKVEAIDMFTNFLRIVGLQKSIGEIYRPLFVSAKPLSIEHIMNRPDISFSAASQGLKLLRGLGAVKAIIPKGSSRSHFAADLESSKFKEDLGPASNGRWRESSTWNRSLRRCRLKSAKRQASA
jgi:DNA-binding transcriptional regulator GbsR (MarR family)